MPHTFKLAMRVVETRDIASFELEEGETLDSRVPKEIAKANEAGLLGKVATRVLPSAIVTEIAEGENLAGGENVVSSALYGFDGTPLSDRSIRVTPLDNTFVAVGVEDNGSAEGGEEKTIGVFPTEDLAYLVAQMWQSGYLPL